MTRRLDHLEIRIFDFTVNAATLCPGFYVRYFFQSLPRTNFWLIKSHRYLDNRPSPAPSSVRVEITSIKILSKNGTAPNLLLVGLALKSLDSRVWIIFFKQRTFFRFWSEVWKEGEIITDDMTGLLLSRTYQSQSRSVFESRQGW